MAQEIRKVAVFDIDGTIFRSSLFIELTEELIDSGVFEESVRDEYAREKEAWLDRKGDYEAYINAMVCVFLGAIKGVHYADFQEAAKRAVDRSADRVYRYTRDLVKDLRAKGYYLVAISQSPKSILDRFCKRMGFHKVYGRIYELGPGDRFTGAIEDLHLIGNKANILKRVVEKENLTLKGSVGVGDTEGDIAFLEMVDKPICFNPNAKLLKHAKRLGWKVIVERKDVIYDIA